MRKPMSIKQKQDIDEFLESFYPKAKKIGEDLVSVRLKKTQVRGFETMVASVTRFSDVVNYVKNQAGKDNKKADKADWSLIASDMLNHLEILENKAKEIGEGDPGLVLAIKMKLARGWARQVSTHYFYQESLTGS